MKKNRVVAMYSGQLDSIAAICAYIDQNPKDEIFLLNIASGVRIEEDQNKYILDNSKILMHKFKNIKKYESIYNYNNFINLSIIPLNFENNFLKGSSVCFGCLINIYSEALLYSKRMNANGVLTGFRAYKSEYENTDSILFYMLKKIENIYMKHNVKIHFPIKYATEKELVSQIVHDNLGFLKIPKYSCIFKNVKNMNCAYTKHRSFFDNILNMAFENFMEN